jgi:hypothetical protein
VASPSKRELRKDDQSERNDVGSVAQSEFIHDGRPKGIRGRFSEPDPAAAVHEGRSDLAD